jgi:hypothetical protein
MSEIDARNNGYFTTANMEYQFGTSSMYGSTLDRGESGYGYIRRYPKGLRANATGTAVLTSPGGNIVPLVLAAGQEAFYRFTSIVATHALGTSNLNNFVIIWD